MPPKRRRPVDSKTNTADQMEGKLVFKRPKPSSNSRIFMESHATPSKKPVRGARNAGKLAQLKTMPLEVFYEITSWLHPLDLLKLSRVSKHLREMFMSKHSEALWVAARRNVSGGLPDPPSTINEAQYAALLFEQNCQACGVGRSIKVDFSFFVRFCGACYHENVMNGKKLLRQFKGLDPVIFSMMPYAAMDNYYIEDPVPKTKDNTSCLRYYKPYFDAVAERLRRLPAGSDEFEIFVNEMRAVAAEMFKRNHDMHMWLDRVARDKENQAKITKREREASIKKKLIEMGYTEADFPLHDYSWVNIMRQPRVLTPRIWTQVKPQLVSLIEQKRVRDHQAAIVARLKTLTRQVKSHYEKHILEVPEDERPWILPLVDLLKLREVDNLLKQDESTINLTEDNFRSIMNIAESEGEKFKATTEAKLLSQLKEIYHLHDDDIFSIQTSATESRDIQLLHRATSVFERGSFSRLEQGRALNSFDGLIEAYGRLDLRFKNRPPVVSVDAVRMAQLILKTLGLPEDLPLNELPTTFSCGCADPSLSYPMDFHQLVQHILEETKYYNDIVSDASSKGDPSFRPQNNHDLETAKMPFIHICADGPRPAFDFGQWRPEKTNRRTLYCFLCAKFVGSWEAHIPSFDFITGEEKRFIHHVKTKYVSHSYWIIDTEWTLDSTGI
ncbi:unnamed protein product [Somion occarium]|uniref:F-box domain-containing protein n=1 Tax=Somion occarium TaxID=3059160 RepID=A0ABP1DYX4_9APHY